MSEATKLSPDGLDSRARVLTLLFDATNREILRLLSEEALTAREVAERTDIPLSTVHRKLDRLRDTPLVETSIRIKSKGRPPRQYHSTFDSIRISLPDGETGTWDLHRS